MSTFCLIVLEPDGQRMVLRQAYDRLRMGGVYITGCVVRPADVEEELRQLARWETFMEDAGLDPEDIREQRASWDGGTGKHPHPPGRVPGDARRRGLHLHPVPVPSRLVCRLRRGGTVRGQAHILSVSMGNIQS
ncbi:hypothetical protein [Methanogenium cariaci]|uniref:hypothetical protein n=1 Tax=Methanogenium cariaci TaxID=2197 RepID=UPI0007859840|nr:hypothetical protein [Methanogenium cariaci]